MGRGRQKAKHTKVARELKYFSPDTDLSRLEQELGGNPRLEDDLDKWPEFQGSGDAEFQGSGDAEYQASDDSAADSAEEDDEAQSA